MGTRAFEVIVLKNVVIKKKKTLVFSFSFRYHKIFG